MPTLYAKDLLSEARLLKTAMGYQATRKFLVTNSVSNTIGQARLQDALNTSQVPDIGDVHPQYSDLLMEKIEATPASGSNDVYVLTATYTPPNENNRKPSKTGPCVVEVNAVTVDKEYVQTKDGVVMYIRCLRNGNQLPDQPVKVKLPFPMTYITARRLEPQPFIFTQQPFDGAVNSVTWNAFGTYAPRTARCMGIKTKDEGSAVRVQYEFMAYGASGVITSNTFDVFALYKDPNTKEDINTGLTSIPPSATNPPSFRILPEMDFNALNLH